MIQSTIASEKQVEPADLASIPSLRLGDNEAARTLLRQWMEDESGCDEKVWPLVKEMIEDNRLSERKRFAE